MPRNLPQILRFMLLCIGGFIFTVPLLWMLSTALKPIDQTMSNPPVWLPYAYTVERFGRSVQVGVSRAELDVPDDQTVDVAYSYQWIATIGDAQVPVRPLGDLVHAEPADEINVIAMHTWVATLEGVEVEARRADENPDPASPDQVEILVPDPDGVFFRHTVPGSSIRRVYGQTRDDVESAMATEQEFTLKAGDIRRRIVDWDERNTLAFVQTGQLQVAAGDISTSIMPRWGNFAAAIKEMAYFPQYLWNSLTLCVLTVVGTVFSCSLVAYGFSRIDWPGRDKVFLVLLATMMIPFPVIMVPLYGLFRDLGWIGTLQPLWVPTFFASAFNVFLLRQFFRTIPRELSEAATIDGCGHLRIFLQIILPLAKPAIAVVALFQFLATWNDFMGPLIYLTDQEDFTLALGLQFFQSRQGGTQWHYLMAASTLVVLPVILLFFFAQRTFIEGISMTGMKG
ncbi:carbohydrate ABC transporter permease [Mucisphaera calidilacus]|uniref:L-arabinose transport system permease protein AraQ n=1 Tax=Mucisphaera calidilacus TaxID=2527982 RepID=A0A518BVD2_9BACT|nr:carbohydrate ABC transporter permease [Mucisphaera calidilacus]QDU70907.1 L-arabinose transport system permease protein AraQ [Mucisphaera calidilacus]